MRAISTRAAPGHETAGCTVRSDCGHDFHRELKVQPSTIRPVPRPRIVVLATGGTIASTLPHAQARAQDYAVTRAAGDLLSCVPQAGQIADLHCIDLMSLPSHDIGNEELLAMSETDGLTNLANRRKFDLAYESEWERALRLQQPMGRVKSLNLNIRLRGLNIFK